MEELDEKHFNKNHPFKVPEDYFKELPYRINEKITQKEERAWSYLPTFRWVLPGAVVAACAIFLIVFFQGPAENNYNQILSGISDENVIAYLETFPLSEAEIYSYFDDTDDVESEILYNELLKFEEIDEDFLFYYDEDYN